MAPPIFPTSSCCNTLERGRNHRLLLWGNAGERRIGEGNLAPYFEQQAVERWSAEILN
jgi:hypothetical protein